MMIRGSRSSLSLASSLRPKILIPRRSRDPHTPSNIIPYRRRLLFNKARQGRSSAAKSIPARSVDRTNPRPVQFGPINTSWGRTLADLGPIPRVFYLRHESTILQPRHSGASAWFGLMSLTGVNLAVFVMWNEDDQDEEWMMQNFTTNIENTMYRPWSLSTSSVSHQNAMHIAGNMFAMWLFGFGIYRVIGAVEFFKLYVLGGMSCSGVHVLHNVATGKTQPPLSKDERDRIEEMAKIGRVRSVQELPPNVRDRVERADKPSLGASGSVMAISAVAAALFPLDRVRPHPRLLYYLPLPVAVGMFVTSDLIGITQEGSPTDHAGHLGGLAFGAFYAWNSWYSGRWGVAGQLPIVYRFRQMMTQGRG